MNIIDLISKAGKIGVFCAFESTEECEKYTVILEDKTAYNIVANNDQTIIIEEIELNF